MNEVDSIVCLVPFGRRGCGWPIRSIREAGASLHLFGCSPSRLGVGPSALRPSSPRRRGRLGRHRERARRSGKRAARGTSGLRGGQESQHAPRDWRAAAHSPDATPPRPPPPTVGHTVRLVATWRTAAAATRPSARRRTRPNESTRDLRDAAADHRWKSDPSRGTQGGGT